MLKNASTQKSGECSVFVVCREKRFIRDRYRNKTVNTNGVLTTVTKHELNSKIMEVQSRR